MWTMILLLAAVVEIFAAIMLLRMREVGHLSSPDDASGKSADSDKKHPTHMHSKPHPAGKPFGKKPPHQPFFPPTKHGGSGGLGGRGPWEQHSFPGAPPHKLHKGGTPSKDAATFPNFPHVADSPHRPPHGKPFHGKHGLGFKGGTVHPKSGLADHRSSTGGSGDFGHAAEEKFWDKEHSRPHGPHAQHPGSHWTPWPGEHGPRETHVPAGHPDLHHPHAPPHHKHPLPGKTPHGKSTSFLPHGPKEKPMHTKLGPKLGHEPPYGLQHGLPTFPDGTHHAPSGDLVGRTAAAAPDTKPDVAELSIACCFAVLQHLALRAATV